MVRPYKRQAKLIGGLGGGGGLFGRTRGRGITFDVVGVPGKVALEAILYMGRRGEAVVLAGVDDEFGGHATNALESLIELFGIDDGDVPIDFAAHDQSGSNDRGDFVEGGNFFVKRAVFPRKAELELPRAPRVSDNGRGRSWRRRGLRWRR